MFALDCLYVLLANNVVLWVNVPLAAQRRRPACARCDDRWRVIATVVPLSSPHNSTFYRALRSIRDGGRAGQHGRSRPSPAPGAGPATPPDSPGGAQGLFFEFFHNGDRTDVQHACGIANAAGIQSYIDYLLLHLR